MNESRLKSLGWVGLLILGVVIRMWIAAHTDHMDSQCFYASAKVMMTPDVYAIGSYNYAPVWGWCLWAVRQGLLLLHTESYMHFRLVVVFLLSCADVAMAVTLACMYDWKKAMLFYFMPVCVMITSQQMQMDNLAVLIGLWGWLVLQRKAQGGGVIPWSTALQGFALLGLSLCIKHDLLFFPLALVFWPALGPIWRRMVLCLIPYVLFAVSFAPYAPYYPLIINSVFTDPEFTRKDESVPDYVVWDGALNQPSPSYRQTPAGRQYLAEQDGSADEWEFVSGVGIVRKGAAGGP